jgi:hypothetical protein
MTAWFASSPRLQLDCFLVFRGIPEMTLRSLRLCGEKCITSRRRHPVRNAG